MEKGKERKGNTGRNGGSPLDEARSLFTFFYVLHYFLLQLSSIDFLSRENKKNVKSKRGNSFSFHKIHSLPPRNHLYIIYGSHIHLRRVHESRCTEK